jgi:hypothetical protein
MRRETVIEAVRSRAKDLARFDVRSLSLSSDQLHATKPGRRATSTCWCPSQELPRSITTWG